MSYLLLARAHWKIIGIGLLCLLLAVQSVRLGHAHNVIEQAKVNLNECRQGRIDDRKAYEQAQRDAQVKNDADVSRIVGEQEKINEASKRDTNSRLERLRSELRKGTAPAKGHSGSPQAGPADPGSPGVDGEAGLCLTSEELLSAAESEERHDQLITLMEKLMGIQR